MAITQEQALAELQRRGIQTPNISPAVFTREQALGELQKRGVQIPEAQPLSISDVATQAIQNLPGSAGQFARDIIQPFVPVAVQEIMGIQNPTGPIATAKSLGTLAKGLFSKLIPGEQPSEAAVDALGEFFKERYGGIENIKQTIATDPVGFASDLSLILTGGAAAATKIGKVAGATGKAGRAATEIGNVLRATGRLVEPMNLARAPIRTIAKLTPDVVAERLISSGVKFRQKARESTRAFDVRKQKIINAALDEKITPSKSGLRKTEKLITKYTNEVDDIIEKGIREGTGGKILIKTDDVLDRMNDLRDRFEFSIVGDDFIDEMEKLRTSVKERFGETLTPQQAQQIKRSTQKDLGRFFGQEVAVKKELAKQVTRGLREELEKAFPEIANLNQKASSLLALEEEFGKAVKNMTNRGIFGLTSKILAGGGIAAGDAKLGFMSALFNEVAGRPRVKAKLAIVLDQAGRKGITGKQIPTLLRQLAFQAGRLPATEQTPEMIEEISGIRETNGEETQKPTFQPRLSQGLRKINGSRF